MLRIKAGIASKVVVVFSHLVTDYYFLKRRGAAQPKINRVTLRVMEKKSSMCFLPSLSYF